MDSSSPPVSQNKMERYYAKFGKERCEQMIPYMKQVGRSHGINFSYGGLIGNTFNSHRLVQLAKNKNKQDEMMEVLFKYYFEQEKDINDNDVLAAAAVEAKVATKEEVLAMLTSGALADEVRADIQKSRQEGCTGVPYFIIESSLGSATYTEQELSAMKASQLKGILKQRRLNAADCVEKRDFIAKVLSTNNLATPRVLRDSLSGAQETETWMEVFRKMQVV